MIPLNRCLSTVFPYLFNPSFQGVETHLNLTDVHYYDPPPPHLFNPSFQGVETTIGAVQKHDGPLFIQVSDYAYKISSWL